VERLGRVDYGPRLGEAKGITGGILHERQYRHDVRARGLRLDALDDFKGIGLRELPEDGAPGGLYRGTPSRCRAPGTPVWNCRAGRGDTRVELPGRTREFVWLIGLGLGRCWSAGPQRSLYVPGPVLREGVDDVGLLELEETARSDSGTPGAVVLRAV
jgi:beta-galactosidase